MLDVRGVKLRLSLPRGGDHRTALEGSLRSRVLQAKRMS